MRPARPLVVAMSHPVVIGAVVVLVVNDHALKSLSPSWATGNLSDFAGLVFFPILLGAVVELVLHMRIGSRRLLLWSVVATGIVFAAVQLLPDAGNAYQSTMGYLQWPFRLIADGSALPGRVALTQDPTDLIVLPALWLAWRLGTRRVDPDPAL